MPDTAPPSAFMPTQRTRVRRHPERAHYDRDTVFAILDAALLCHVGYVIDDRPYVTPILFWRDGGRLYWHGSAASRMLRTQAQGIPVCVTVSHVDGLILARSAFRHSLNYRAVMAFGTAAPVTNPKAKEAGFNAFIERLYPGRTAIMRGILPQEIKATALMSMTIDDASAKIRNGGPLDLETDYDAACWAWLVPVT
ncbi:MAG: pyridoxamine 5'-phosphate oxidase family protein, partial [Stellaceae bacterium]